jgi:predicted nucleic acid-binding protein
MRVVVDTSVLFEGLTKKAGACRLIVNAWRVGRLKARISNSHAYEYEDVLARKLSAARWAALQQALAALLNQSERVKIYITWRPSSPDPGDDLVIDCALTAGVTVVTSA